MQQMTMVKTRTYGIRSAIIYPFIPVLVAAADFLKKDNVSSSLVAFIFTTLLGIGGYNNIVKVSPNTIEVWNAYWRWWKKRQVRFDQIKSVFVDGSGRYSSAIFRCLLNDGATFEFRSTFIGRSRAKKIAGEFIERGIEVETYRL